MIWFYLLGFLPMIIGAVLWLNDSKINLWEWLIAAAVGISLAGIFHVVSIHGMTADEETWSGQILSVRQFSAWNEYYEYAVYRTVCHTTCSGSGKNRTCSTTCVEVFDHWQPTTAHHAIHWVAFSNIQTQYEITHEHFIHLEQVFGGAHSVPGVRETGEHNSRMIGGDPNDYVADNRTGYIEPITKVVNFTNRVKAAPSIFSFVKLPKTIPIFSWPKPPNPWQSTRLLGISSKAIPIRKWDELNATLGPTSRVNLILIGFDSNDSMLGQYQEAAFIGGKKNDLVITYGPSNEKPTWCKVFGWTESDDCKRDIESYVIENGVSVSLLEFLKQEVRATYKLKNWHKFDYIAIEPAPRYYYWFIGILCLLQGGLWTYFQMNEFDKRSS